MAKIILLILILAVFIIAVFYGAFLLKKPGQKVACTMEAKLCPDGSYVGRTGPNCEFAACPVVEKSGIKGVALLGPICPVERIPPDPNCADRPYKTDLVATNGDQSLVVKQFSSDDDGKFSVDLLPGEYFISSADTAKFFSHCSSQVSIKVEKNKYTDITLHCDTGIR